MFLVVTFAQWTGMRVWAKKVFAFYTLIVGQAEADFARLFKGLPKILFVGHDNTFTT